MKTFFDCMPCFVRQALDSARLVSDDEAVHELVLRKVLALAAEMDLSEPPPKMGQKIHRIIREALGDPDPYRETKDEFTEVALALYPKMKRLVAESRAPLDTAVRLAIAGNLIDFGPRSDLDVSEVEPAVAEALSGPLVGEIEPFREALEPARTLLYLADNAGEIVFDRVLIEHLVTKAEQDLDVTVAVKGGPTINDAVRRDAEAAGLNGVAHIIDNGSDAPGTVLSECSAELVDRFHHADLVISKGQGNYETLSDPPRPVWFLLKAKCPIISRDVGCVQGSLILAPSSCGR
jgi:hypothetical protein